MQRIVFILICSTLVCPEVTAQVGSSEAPENELGIENGTETAMGLIIGTRVSKVRDVDESMALVGFSGGYVLDNGFDLLLSLDYEAVHVPMGTQQQDRIFLGVSSRRTFKTKWPFDVRIGAGYTQGADLNADAALDYATVEGHVVLLRKFHFPESMTLDLGVGLFSSATQHAMQGVEGLISLRDGIFVGLYVPFTISARMFGHYFRLDKGIRVGYDLHYQSMKMRGAGRGPLHDFSR